MLFLGKFIRTGEMKNYQLTTVNKYIELLDSDLTESEKTIKKAIDKYLYKAQKARANAKILDYLLG